MNTHFLRPDQWHLLLTDSSCLETFTPMEGVLPRTTSFFSTWKTSIKMINTQYTDHFYWIKPVLHTFTIYFATVDVFYSMF